MNEIVTAEWLHKNLDRQDLIILDASIGKSIDGKDSGFSDSTIPNSRPFSLKESFLDKSSPFPNTVPTAEHFEKECQKLGINEGDQIVVFDNLGIYSSPRAWWLFKLMGYDKVAVLDGGLPAWIEMGFPTVQKVEGKFEKGNFKSKYQEGLLVSFQEVENNISEKKFLIADARSEGRFNGSSEEPRKHLKSGKIPNSINVPYEEVLKDGKFRSPEELNELFLKKARGEKELVFSCGSGLTACIIALASELGYSKSKRVYDGSWTEWAELKNLKNTL